MLFDYSVNAPITANVSNHVTQLARRQHDDFNRSETIASLCILFFTLYWNNEKHVCEIVKFFKQASNFLFLTGKPE